MSKEPTDKTIQIKCGECDANEVEHFEIGLEDMIQHIKDKHPQYNPLEADTWAIAWMDDAYDRYDLELEAYNKDLSYEKKLNVLREKP